MSGQISNNITKARQARGYSQEQVARAIGVSRPTYINIEAGKKELTVSQAEALSSVLRWELTIYSAFPMAHPFFLM